MKLLLLLMFSSQWSFSVDPLPELTSFTSNTKGISAKQEVEISQAVEQTKQLILNVTNKIQLCSTYATCERSFVGPSIPSVNDQSYVTCTQDLVTEYQTLFNFLESNKAKCIKMLNTAILSCQASTYAPYVGLITGQLSGSSSGSMYNKCKKAATLQIGMGAISAGLAGTCAFTKNKCESSCAKLSAVHQEAATVLKNTIATVNAFKAGLVQCSNGPHVYPAAENAINALTPGLQRVIETTQNVSDKIEKCEEQEINVISAMLSAQQLISGIAQSQSCQKELAQEDCMKPEAVNNPACTAAYCSNQANQTAPQCAALFGECYSANAGSNPRCACLQNPMQQSCLNLPTVDTNTATRSSASSSTDGYNFDEDDLYADQGDNLGFGAANDKAPGVVGGGQQGGGGGGGQGSALGGGPSGGGSGAQKGVYDTNVTGGTSAGAVGSSGSGGIAGYGGNGGGYGGNLPGSGLGGSKNSLDLKKYLPGGQLAKQRDEADTGITPANGLTNFQKVNRAHNKSRTKLVTP